MEVGVFYGLRHHFVADFIIVEADLIDLDILFLADFMDLDTI